MSGLEPRGRHIGTVALERLGIAANVSVKRKVAFSLEALLNGVNRLSDAGTTRWKTFSLHRERLPACP